jgi:metal-responsive CopG/Arc/MetJ family transcriptional regulator
VELWLAALDRVLLWYYYYKKGITMNRVFTIKMSESLYAQLDLQAQEEGLSRGALVRLALKKMLKKRQPLLDRLQRITQSLAQGKMAHRSQTNWKGIYAQTRKAVTLSPEEEVMRSRRRGL